MRKERKLGDAGRELRRKGSIRKEKNGGKGEWR